jgi:hypothetical protein
MECFICESNHKVVRLIGWHATSRFNICEDCLTQAAKLKPGECFGVGQEIKINPETLSSSQPRMDDNGLGYGQV